MPPAVIVGNSNGAVKEFPLSRFQLTIGSEAFWRAAAADIAGARRRVLVQAMTFEGDHAGTALAEAA